MELSISGVRLALISSIRAPLMIWLLEVVSNSRLPEDKTYLHFEEIIG